MYELQKQQLMKKVNTQKFQTENKSQEMVRQFYKIYDEKSGIHFLITGLIL